MRHKKRRTKLNRTTAHRKATLSMIAKSLFIHQSITTTTTKAKEARRLIEKLITAAKDKSVTSRRRVFSVLKDRDVTGKLFEEISPLYAERHGGYTRIVPKGYRRGDGAELCILELVEKTLEDKTTKSKTTMEKKPKPQKVKKPTQSVKDEEEKPKVLPKPAPEIKPDVKEEKVVEDVKKEKAKREEKKIEKKSFFKKFFQRRTKM